MNYQIEKVAWIECIFVPMKDIHSVTVQIICRAWSMYETEEQSWIAHCLEHMFFKWWERYKNQKEVSEAMDSIWAEFNASTWKWLVDYYVKCAPEFVDKAIDVLSDMIMNAKFDVKELESEKWVIIQEMKMYEDSPKRVLSDKWREWYIGKNSFWRPTIWNIDTVNSFTPQDLKKYKASLYTKDNLIIVIAWKIEDKEKIQKLIERCFVWLLDKKTVQKPNFVLNLPHDQESYYHKETEQNHLIISAQWFDWFHKDRFSAKVLASVLGGNMSSRLFQNIRTKQWLCYYISAYHNAWSELWLFMIRAWMNKDKFQYWLEKIREEIDNLSKNGITKEEFEKTIWYLQWQIQMWIETSDEMSDFIWGQYIVYDRIESLEDILQGYKNLTLDDVNKLIWMLDLNNCYTFYID